MVLDWSNDPIEKSVRVGDSLLIDIDEAVGTPIAIDIADDGSIDLSGEVGGGVALPGSAAPGVTIYRCMADIDGDGFFDPYAESVALLKLTAVSLEMVQSISSQIGYERRISAFVHPADQNVGLEWDSSDQTLLNVSEVAPADLEPKVIAEPGRFGRRLSVRVWREGEPYLLARLDSGELVEALPVHEYRIRSSFSDGFLIIRDSFGYGSTTLTITIDPAVPDQVVKVGFLSGTSTIDGQSQVEFSTDELSADGTWSAEVILEPGTSVTCHRIQLFDALVPEVP
jgi:hypothetical protein